MDTTIENMINSIDLSAPVPEYEPMRQYYYLKACRKIVKEKSEALNRPLTAVVSTFGCQMNARDSEKLLGILKDIGYQESDDEENADFVIYNTCTVRENANLRVYGRLGQLKKVKRANGEMIIAMCGCMMQEPEVVEKIKTSYKFVDIVFGTFNIFKLAELMYMCFTGDEQVIDIWDSTKEVVEELPTSRKYPFKSGVNIMFGCNNFCTYCIIPYARGRVRSRKPESVIKQAKELVAKGYVEIVLTGIHTAGYGEDLENYSFYDLLVDLTKIEGLKRLRISSIETSQITDDIIDLISKSKIIVDHLHVPLQAGCDETLKRMNRKYNCEQYYEKLSKIRRLIPDIVFTTDVIVGFPGESEEEFEKTYEFIKKVGYTQLHVFPYSMRKGTPAARMVQVDEKIKHERVNRLIALSHELNENYAKSQIGKTLRVLFEKEDHGYYVGHGDNYLLIKVQSDEQLIGQLKNVIIDSYDEMLIGRVV